MRWLTRLAWQNENRLGFNYIPRSITKFSAASVFPKKLSDKTVFGTWINHSVVLGDINMKNLHCTDTHTHIHTYTQCSQTQIFQKKGDMYQIFFLVLFACLSLFGFWMEDDAVVNLDLRPSVSVLSHRTKPTTLFCVSGALCGVSTVRCFCLFIIDNAICKLLNHQNTVGALIMVIWMFLPKIGHDWCLCVQLFGPIEHDFHSNFSFEIGDCVISLCYHLIILHNFCRINLYLSWPSIRNRSRWDFLRKSCETFTHS